MLVEGRRLTSRARLVRVRAQEMRRRRGVMRLRSGHVVHVRTDGSLLLKERSGELIALARRRRKEREVGVVEVRVELLGEALGGVEGGVGEGALDKGLLGEAIGSSCGLAIRGGEVGGSCSGSGEGL